MSCYARSELGRRVPTSGNFAPEWKNIYRESTGSGPNGTRSTLKLLTSSKSKSTPLRTGLLLRASLGNCSLLRDEYGFAWARPGASSAIQISSPEGINVGCPSSTWQVLAVDNISGVNQILWRSNSANILHTWSLDANWNYTASGGIFPLASREGSNLLTQFGLIG
jgi:hypothetical protein